MDHIKLSELKNIKMSELYSLVVYADNTAYVVNSFRFEMRSNEEVLIIYCDECTVVLYDIEGDYPVEFKYRSDDSYTNKQQYLTSQ